MTAEHAAVWEILQAHRGHRHAIRQSELAALAGLSVRSVQGVLKDLTERYRRPIVSSCSRPFGCYLPESDAEVQEYVDQLRSRAISCFRRVRALSEAAAVSLHREVQQELWASSDPANTRVRRICACGCGEDFEPARPDQLYATSLHRYNAANQRRA